MKRPIRITQSILFFFLFFFFNVLVYGQVSIPAKFDGFVYKNRPADLDSIIIEAFFDPVCPDSRDAWPPLKQALKLYEPRVSLIVHPFALPYAISFFSTLLSFVYVEFWPVWLPRKCFEQFGIFKYWFYFAILFGIKLGSAFDCVLLDLTLPNFRDLIVEHNLNLFIWTVACIDELC